MSTTEQGITAAEVRRRVGHPVVDGDGHFLELMPLVNDEIMSYLEEAGGTAIQGGEGSAVRTLLGTVVISVIEGLLLLWGFSTQMQYLIVGVIVLGVIMLHTLGE